jgi:hypothetical protein
MRAAIYEAVRLREHLFGQRLICRKGDVVVAVQAGIEGVSERLGKSASVNPGLANCSPNAARTALCLLRVIPLLASRALAA